MTEIKKGTSKDETMILTTDTNTLKTLTSFGYLALSGATEEEIGLLPETKTLIIAGKEPSSSPALQQARKAGKRVSLVHISKEDTKESVERKIIAAQSSYLLPTPLPPEKISNEVYTAINGTFVSLVEQWASEKKTSRSGPPVRLVRCTTGSGKSFALRKAAIKLWKKFPNNPVVISTPTLALAEEQAAALREETAKKSDAGSYIQPTIMVWYGRDARNSQGEVMCRDKEKAAEIAKRGLSPSKYYCDTKCPFKDSCLHREQRKKSASILIVTHAMLFHEPPKAAQNASAILIDETPENQSITGLSKDERLNKGLPSSWLKQAVSDNLAITNGRRLLSEYLDRSSPGFASSDGIRTEDARHILFQYERALLSPETKNLNPKREGIREASYRSAELKIVPYLVSFIKRREGLIPDFDGSLVSASGLPCSDRLSALLRIDHAHDQNWLTLCCASLPRLTKNTPCLIVSATPSLLMLKCRWPRIEMLCDLQSESPHGRIIQHPGREWSKTSLNTPKNDEKETPERARASLRALITSHENRSKNLLVIGQKSITDMLAQRNLDLCQPFKTTTETAHFNALAGIDKWGPGKKRSGVDRLIVIGRPMPPVSAVEDISRALFRTHPAIAVGQPTAPGQAPAWYPSETGYIQTTSGETRPITRNIHPDAFCETVRSSICDAEIAQAIGRARPTRRTEKNPCEIHVYASASIPCLINTITAWTETPITHAHLMETAGLVFASPKHAANHYRETLWSKLKIKNPESAIKQSRHSLKSLGTSVPDQNGCDKNARRMDETYYPSLRVSHVTGKHQTFPETEETFPRSLGSDTLYKDPIENLTLKTDREDWSGTPEKQPESCSSGHEVNLPSWTPPPGWTRIVYQATGRGRKPATVWASPEVTRSGSLIPILTRACQAVKIKIISSRKVLQADLKKTWIWKHLSFMKILPEATLDGLKKWIEKTLKTDILHNEKDNSVPIKKPDKTIKIMA